MKKLILSFLFFTGLALGQIDEIGGIATSTLDLAGYSEIGGQAIAGGGGGDLPSSSGLYAWWAMDDASGSAVDASGNARSLSAVNATYSQGALVYGSSIALVDASAAYLQRSSETAMNVPAGGDLVVGGVFELTNLASTVIVIGRWNSSSNLRGWIVLYSSSTGKIYFRVSNNGTAETEIEGPTAALSTKYRFIAQLDNSEDTLTFWVNGTKYTTAFAADLYNPSELMYVGRTGANVLSDLKVDELFCYIGADLAFSDGEASAVDNSGNWIQFSDLP